MKKQTPTHVSTQRSDLNTLNAKIIGAFSGSLNTVPEAVVRQALDIATPTLMAKAQAKRLFDNLDCIFHVEKSRNCKTSSRGQRALGFHNGKLVECDGRQYRPISLADSVSLYQGLVADLGSASWDVRAVSRWCKMLAGALRHA